MPSHPDHGVASRSMDGFGGVVTFEVEADFDSACRFVDACRIPYIAPSLGGVETLIEMPALMSLWDQTPEQRTRAEGASTQNAVDRETEYSPQDC